MRIKKIELIGFKSFKDRTVIQFDAGITGIVGPNGCGKSNIVDALVWVMGEMSAKDLRGSSMTDVIFAGAEGYSPSGMAEVSLTLENDGGAFPAKYLKHSEVMVTRRLFRNGESEYLINKEPARLRDIQEIFMDTGAGSKGFSIIQQGMIGKIITAKPEDRRMLIEEAAGITKFKIRKRESQRKLESTDQNLVRLADIIGELKRQIDSLERQAQRAERFRNLKNQIESLELWLSSLQFKELKAAADEAQVLFQDLQSQEQQGAANLSTLQAQLESLKLEILELEKQIELKQEGLSSQQTLAQKKELEIQELKFEIEQARRNEQMTGGLLSEQRARLDLLLRDQAQWQDKANDAKSVTEKLRTQYLDVESSYSEAQARVSEVDNELTEQRRELFALGQTESSIDAKLSAIRSQHKDQTERFEHEQSTLHELRQKQGEFLERRKRISLDFDRERQLHLDLHNDVDSFEANKKVLQEGIHQRRQELQEFKDQLNEVASRLYGLENLQSNFEGFSEGVKSVMLWQKAKQTEITADGSLSFSPISEVVEVPSDFEVAMEAALGSRLQLLVAEGSDSAIQAVDYLKQNQKGRSSFLIDATPTYGFSSTPNGEGVEALLKDIVQVSESQRSQVSFILDGVAIVDSIRTALRLRPQHPGWTFVTKEGDTLSSDGVLTGGSSESADSGVLKRRREIRELSEQREQWAGKVALAQASLKKLEEQLSSVAQDFEGAKKRKQDQEIKVTELRKDLERAETELENAQMAIERQDRSLLKVQEALGQLEAKVQELEESWQETKNRKNEIEVRVNQLQQELSHLRLSFDGMQSQVVDLKSRWAAKEQEMQGFEQQLSMLQRNIDELNSQLSKMNEETQKSQYFVSENQVHLQEQKLEFENLLSAIEQQKALLASDRDIYEQKMHSLRQCEENLHQSQRLSHERSQKISEIQIKFEQAKMKEQYLIEQMRERYMLDLSQVYEQYLHREGDRALAESELKDLKEKVSKIGDVNLSAIDEFEETKKRYEFLTQQQQDLLEAKDQLRRVIDRINRICSKRFKETFDLVNERFQKVFPVLFGGGEARLDLHEDEEKGEMGIEITARPPGKKMQNISLLSGGEKALTAVSLVFSIFLVKPSPYCLLDEVDAPLDDANVFRFNELVREMAKRSQIIVVTHNKHTMEVAGKLYGVTMQERGVSTMVSVNLQDVK